MAGKSPMEKIREAGETPMREREGAGIGKSVTLAFLQKKYGPEEGRRIYFEVARVGGFGDLRSIAYVTLPPLDLTGLTPESIEAQKRTNLERARTETRRAAVLETARAQTEASKAVAAVLAKANASLKPAEESAKE